ncbi:hypothetical protein B0H10DRAFT_1992181, partial [Mycena sp. CBHHK59/15]
MLQKRRKSVRCDADVNQCITSRSPRIPQLALKNSISGQGSTDFGLKNSTFGQGNGQILTSKTQFFGQPF